MFQDKYPYVIFVISGKRKSGKDYVAKLLQERLGTDDCEIIRLSAPLKKLYAKENNLDYEKLLDSSEYKENFREDMIKWGEEIRKKDPGYFCRQAIEMSDANLRKIWIVSDARRKTDIDFFYENYPILTNTVRVVASDSVRKQRRWKFTPGIDDAESECGLDNYPRWDYIVLNDDQIQLMETLSHLFFYGASMLNSF